MARLPSPSFLISVTANSVRFQIGAQLFDVGGFESDVVEAVLRFAFEVGQDLDVLMIVDFEAAGGHFREAEALAIERLCGHHIVCFERDVRNADDGGSLRGRAGEDLSSEEQRHCEELG